MEYFPGFNTLQLSEEVKSSLLRVGETPENFTGRTIFMSMFNDISQRSWKIVDTLFSRFGNQLSLYGAVAEMCDEYETPSRSIRAT